ncbi:MAG: hypothetical protein K0R60_790 [Microbacterium sp.]|jgi:hypothetical protein|nr:hypothetical protein [Microbacterium sp.]
MNTRRIRFALPIALASALALTGCSLLPSGQDTDAEPSPTVTTEASPTPTAESDAGGTEDMFVERDEFFATQQQIPGQGELVARTDAQIELVARQREYVESQGVAWTAELESITLALGLDACETSILNGHAVDADVFRTHVATSPLISAVAGDDTAAQAGVVDIMVYGTGFLCPDDAPQWEAAMAEAGF